jgi:hypothetical protein
MIEGTTRLAAIVTVLSGIIGWWITDYAQRVLNKPTVYHFAMRESIEEEGVCEGFRKYLVSIRNISTSAQLPEFTLVVRIPSNPAAFKETIERRCAPNVIPTGIGEVNQPEVSPRPGQLEIKMSEGILAGSSFEVPVYFENDEDITPKFTYTADNEMRVLENGLESFILRNELRILTLLIVLLTLLSILVLYFANRESKS